MANVTFGSRRLIVNVIVDLAPKLFQPIVGRLDIIVDDYRELFAAIELPGADVGGNQTYRQFKEFFFRHCNLLQVVMKAAGERANVLRRCNHRMSLYGSQGGVVAC